MNNKELIVEGFIKVHIENDDNFLKVRETLRRVGIANRRDKTLVQTCHILHKKGNYYIVHFKELFMLDGKPTSISDEDYLRRNTIAKLLEQWGLVKIESAIPDEDFVPRMVKIVGFNESKDWKLISKYTLGKRRG